MRLMRELRSHLHYKIILPFLLLTLMVALTGSAVAFLFITDTAQERLNNQLAQAARDTSDRLVQHESTNLLFLRELAFAQPNPQANAPALADALAKNDLDGLQRALDPYYRIALQRGDVLMDRLIVFDTSGHSVIDWEQTADASGTGERVQHPARALESLWFVPRILAGKSDEQGDKFAGLLDLGEGTTRYFFTVAPVTYNNRIVGGLLIATRIDTLLTKLQTQSQTAMITVYSTNGQAFASTTTPTTGIGTLSVRSDLVPEVRDLKIAEQTSIFSTVSVNQRNYQFAYAPLLVRNNIVGLFSVALASDYVTGPWAAARLPLAGLTAALMLAIVGLGIIVARQLTRPLQELVSTARAVTNGDLERRSLINTTDEVGVLSRSFNEMTGYLLNMYRVVQSESSQRAAIVESITDGVIVCNLAGDILVINRAMRDLLSLPDDAGSPTRFADIPLHPLDGAALSFGSATTPDLYTLNERVVRVDCAVVRTEAGVRLGDVYVLQDLTNEVAVDRAKTNFIATISHELRTPLTVLGGSSELLLRNMAGPLNDEQRMLIESMRKHAQSMTGLLNNVITIANLESGTLTFELEPIDLSNLIESMLWPIRASMVAKGLELRVDLPAGLPEILADEQHLRIVLHQLLDNARRYTDAGAVTIRARFTSTEVQVDISDTGRGISPDFCEQLFTRFARGSEGINSAERGIGLGLAIARELLEQQGGKIWLAETSEHGSTFSFSLPCACACPVSHDSRFATAA